MSPTKSFASALELNEKKVRLELNHCMLFDVTRRHDETASCSDPRGRTAEHDRLMWKALEG